MIECYEACPDKLSRRHFICKSFMKDEFYMEYKHARAINSRTDEFKCHFGPFIKAIENVVYKHAAFIKHVPVRDRPGYIDGMLRRAGAKYAATDYTAFESLFTAEIMQNCEMIMYKHMTQHLPERDHFKELCDVLMGMTVCQFKNFTAHVEATRMSGEMNTSLGNGFSNLMFMLFMCEVVKNMKNVVGVVEGDDGLFVGDGEWPTEQDFSNLGLIIKMEMHEELNTASFCGLIYDEVDQKNLTDPIAEILTLGWTTRRYARARPNKLKMLLRSKALSMAHQYPGCPIVQELAMYALRVTRSIDIRHFVYEGAMSEWERTQLIQALEFGVKNLTFPEPGMRSRELMERKFGVTIAEQLQLEEYFRNKDDLLPITCHVINMHAHRHWSDYYSVYSTTSRVDSREMEYPAYHFHKLPKRGCAVKQQ